MPLKAKVNETLLRLPRRDVRLAANLLKLKLCAQLRKDGLLIIAHDIKAATFQRAIGRESRNDNRTARLQSPPQRRNVSATVIGGGQKMKHGSVMPKTKTTRRLERS